MERRTDREAEREEEQKTLLALNMVVSGRYFQLAGDSKQRFAEKTRARRTGALLGRWVAKKRLAHPQESRPVLARRRKT